MVSMEGEEELVQLFKVASKAADAAVVHCGADGGGGEDDENRCVDALNRINKIPVTSQLLVSTQVGKGLRRLTKHPRKGIQTVAWDLFQYWKQIVSEESNSISSKRKQSVTTTKPPPVKAAASAAIDDNKSVKRARKTQENSTPNTAAAGESKSSSNGAVDKMMMMRRSKEESSTTTTKAASLAKCSRDPARDKVRKLLVEALSKVYKEVEVEVGNMVDAEGVAVRVESVMFEKWGSINGAHKAKYRSVMFNLKDANNPDFRRKVLVGEVKAERLLTMSTQEMASEQRQKENKKIEQKAMFECELGGPPKATTDQFKCGRCGQRKCTYYQMQTRSADEPMTTYVTCVNCNNHWKFC